MPIKYNLVGILKKMEDDMEVLFATTNPAKILSYKDKLEKHGIKVLTLKELGLNIEVKETGKTAIENAIIKAETYGKIAKKITIGIDTNLFFENIPEDKQPGTHVRRVDGKTLTDEEMIHYYKNLASEYGGKLIAKWVNGIAIYNGKETKTYCFTKNKFYLVNTESKKRHPGYPLDSISIIPEFNKYLTDLTEEELKLRKKKQQNDKTNEGAVEAICQILKNM